MRDITEHTLWCGEVDNVAIALEHIDLLDGLDRLDIELLERCLELLVVGARALVDLLHLSTWSTLASISIMSALVVRCSFILPLIGSNGLSQFSGFVVGGTGGVIEIRRWLELTLHTVILAHCFSQSIIRDTLIYYYSQRSIIYVPMRTDACIRANLA